MSQVNGFIIMAEDGTFLTKKLCWFQHDRREDAWVHPESEIEKIRATFKPIEKKPTHAYRAHWSETEGTVIEGLSLPFAAFK